MMDAMQMSKEIEDSSSIHQLARRKSASDAMNRMEQMRRIYPDLKSFVPEYLDSPERRRKLSSSSSLKVSSSDSEEVSYKSRLIGEMIVGGIRRACDVEDNGLDLEDDAFTAKTRVRFKIGTKDKPEILFKSYANTVFAKLRSFAFGKNVTHQEFLKSLTEKPLRGGCLGEGKSGQLFFQSHDRRYVLKTISEAEHLFLMSFLPDYFMHMSFFPKRSLLCRFLALMSFSCPGSHLADDALDGKKFRVVVMENCFFTHHDIHRKFDLKGSTIKRSVDLMTIESLKDCTLKDLNFTEFDFVALPEAQRTAFLTQLRQDTALLQAHNIMDYSLLLAVRL